MPAKAKVDDYEIIIVKGKSGEKIKMYRRITEKVDNEDVENFTKSWETFQTNLS